MEGQGRSGLMGVVSHQERERLGRAVSKRDRDINRLMDKPGSRRLAIEEAQCDRSIQGFQYKGWRSGQRRVQEFKVAPELMSADTGSGRLGRVREIRKETSECEVRAAQILTKSTLGSGILYSRKGVLSNHAIQVAHLWGWITC